MTITTYAAASAELPVSISFPPSIELSEGAEQTAGSRTESEQGGELSRFHVIIICGLIVVVIVLVSVINAMCAYYQKKMTESLQRELARGTGRVSTSARSTQQSAAYVNPQSVARAGLGDESGGGNIEARGGRGRERGREEIIGDLQVGAERGRGEEDGYEEPRDIDGGNVASYHSYTNTAAFPSEDVQFLERSISPFSITRGTGTLLVNSGHASYTPLTTSARDAPSQSRDVEMQNVAVSPLNLANLCERTTSDFRTGDEVYYSHARNVSEPLSWQQPRPPTSQRSVNLLQPGSSRLEESLWIREQPPRRLDGNESSSVVKQKPQPTGGRSSPRSGGLSSPRLGREWSPESEEKTSRRLGDVMGFPTSPPASIAVKRPQLTSARLPAAIPEGRLSSVLQESSSLSPEAPKLSPDSVTNSEAQVQRDIWELDSTFSEEENSQETFCPIMNNNESTAEIIAYHLVPKVDGDQDGYEHPLTLSSNDLEMSDRARYFPLAGKEWSERLQNLFDDHELSRKAIPEQSPVGATVIHRDKKETGFESNVNRNIPNGSSTIKTGNKSIIDIKTVDSVPEAVLRRQESSFKINYPIIAERATLSAEKLISQWRPSDVFRTNYPGSSVEQDTNDNSSQHLSGSVIRD